MRTVLDSPPAPPPLEEERGGGNEWVELARAANDIEAHLLIGRLEEVGIETRSVKDRSGHGAWLYGGSDPWAPVAVLVHRFQLQDARLVLAEISFDAPPAQEPPPPPTVAERRRRALTFWITAIVLGVLLTSIALLRTAAAVGECGIPLICGESVETGR